MYKTRIEFVTDEKRSGGKTGYYETRSYPHVTDRFVSFTKPTGQVISSSGYPSYHITENKVTTPADLAPNDLFQVFIPCVSIKHMTITGHDGA